MKRAAVAVLAGAIVGAFVFANPVALAGDIADGLGNVRADIRTDVGDSTTRYGPGSALTDDSVDGSGGDTADVWGSGTINETELARAVHAEVNDYRLNQSRGALRWSPELARVATGHSRDMAVNEFFAHTSPTNGTLEARYDRAGIGCPGGENLWKIEGTGVTGDEEALADRVLSSWIASPGHHENLLRERWTREGIGVVVVERGDGLAVYVTQDFC